MFNKNEHKQVLKELAKDQMAAHGSRNRVTTMAVALTALLLSFVFTAGLSFISTMKESSEAAPGPGEDGAIIGTYNHFKEIVQKNNVEWADWVQACSTSDLRNDEFTGIQTELLAPDEGYYLHNEITPIAGTYPQKRDEIMISDTLGERIGIKEVGEAFPIQIMVAAEGETKEELSVSMKICGIYRNPIKNLSSIYEEIYTVSDFINWKNPDIENDYNYIYVKLNDLNPLAMKSDVYSKLETIREETGANYVQTKHYNNFFYSFISAGPVFLFVFLIILSGYFLIYNIFSISITMDVKWFGLMKTIGATQKQITYVYRRQIMILTMQGIFVGVIAGYVLGVALAPRLLAMTSFELYYKNANAAAVLIFTIIFTLITVRIGSFKIIKKAASLSPVDAARFVPHKRKKLIAILSLSLSGIIFIAVGNAVFGYRATVMVERHNQGECEIRHNGSMWELQDVFQPISYDSYEKISKLPFIQNIDIIFKSRTLPDRIDIAGMELYDGFRAQIKQNGLLKKEVNAIIKKSGNADALRIMNNGDIKLEISGIGAKGLEREKAYFSIVEGEVDEKLFSEGDYILYQSPGIHSIAKELESKDKIHAGDTLTIDFYDNQRAGYISKTFKVMSVIRSNDSYSAGNISMSNIIMSDKAFKEIYPDYPIFIAAMVMSSYNPLGGKEIEQITTIMQNEHNSQLMIKSRYNDREKYTKEKESVMLIGLFFSSVLGLIGISNLINTIVMDIVFKKPQIAMLQSIGMTKKQLVYMIFRDSMKLGGISMLIILVFGWFAAAFISSSSMFTGFDLVVFVLESIGIIIFILTLACISAVQLTKWLNKETIVERLRKG